MSATTETKEYINEDIGSDSIIIKQIRKTSNIPDIALDDTFKKIGSEFRGGSPLRPLSRKEEEELLYPYLGLDERDDNLNEKCEKFWINFDVKVPMGGAILNISKNPNGYKNILDYLRYRFAKAHSRVAIDEKNKDNKTEYDFYVENPNAVKQKQNDVIKLKKKAYKEFTVISEDEMQTEYVLRVLGETRVDQKTPVERENALANIVESNPKKFLSVANDKNLKEKALIEELEEANIIEKVGGSYMYMDDIIAETKKEMVAFLKSSKNSKKVNEFKAQLREKKPEKYK